MTIFITSARTLCRVSLAAAGCMIATSTLAQEVDEENKDESFFCLAEQAVYHSNLFHLNRDVTDVEQRLGPGANRENTVLRTSACGEGNWHHKQQELKLRATIDDNRFLDNAILNHTSGKGELIWNWQTAGDWHGQFGGSYQHALGTFLNDRPIVRDLVDSYRYFGEVNHDFGAHITVRIGGDRIDTSHTAESRRVDNYRSSSGVAELILLSRAENFIGIGVRRTQSTYPFSAMIDDVAVDRDYKESIESLRVHYELASKTVLNGFVGHLTHQYQHDSGINYNGGVWRAVLAWQPLTNVQLTFAGWKELTSYFDSEADHFVSRGASFEPLWRPHNKWSISMPLRWERQQFISRSVITTALLSREDKVKVGSLEIRYRPRSSFDLDLSYSHEQHDSNLAVYSYIDEIAALQMRYRF